MTLEEMIGYMDHLAAEAEMAGKQVLYVRFTRVSAALRAGQAMRDAAKRQSEAARMLGFGRQTIDPYIEAWDAALGENK